jgi:hypothetical protein
MSIVFINLFYVIITLLNIIINKVASLSLYKDKLLKVQILL